MVLKVKKFKWRCMKNKNAREKIWKKVKKFSKEERKTKNE